MCTGNTQYVSLNDLLKPVYPCAYREHFFIYLYHFIFSGLSLCIQGTLTLSFNSPLRRRFIPVHTGNTWVSDFLWLAVAVYPCAYREHADPSPIGFPYCGLSLCIQGTLHLFQLSPDIGRFIPVHTGNTLVPDIRPSRPPVYPCAYREHSSLPMSIITCCGLSLCIQGTLMRKKLTQCCARFIPVHTGNTPIITYCFIIKILTTKFLPIFLAIFYQNQYL